MPRTAAACPSPGDDARAEATAVSPALGCDAVDIGSRADSWRGEPDTPVRIRPHLGEVPAVGVERFLRRTPGTPGMVVSAARVRALVDAAARRSAGEALLPSRARPGSGRPGPFGTAG
ncbi:hypothetical protein [Embleya sp. NPDC020886]|uniref:hypothetical protein n=1 Tax=Embleya sp. NPDC020886 TaxID=3363980 RepID=UPI0037ABB776